MDPENTRLGKLLIDYPSPIVLSLLTLTLTVLMFQVFMIEAEKAQCGTRASSNSMHARN